MADQALSWQAADLHALADLLAEVHPGALPTELLDQLEALERIKAAAAATQVVVAAAFADAADDLPRLTRGEKGRAAFDVSHGPTTDSRHTVEVVGCLTPRSALLLSHFWSGCAESSARDGMCRAFIGAVRF